MREVRGARCEVRGWSHSLRPLGSFGLHIDVLCFDACARILRHSIHIYSLPCIPSSAAQSQATRSHRTSWEKYHLLAFRKSSQIRSTKRAAIPKSASFCVPPTLIFFCLVQTFYITLAARPSLTSRHQSIGLSKQSIYLHSSLHTYQPAYILPTSNFQE